MHSIWVMGIWLLFYRKIPLSGDWLTHGKWYIFLRLPAFMNHLSELDYDFTLCFTHNWLLALFQLFLRYPCLAIDRYLAEVGKQNGSLICDLFFSFSLLQIFLILKFTVYVFQTNRPRDFYGFFLQHKKYRDRSLWQNWQRFSSYRAALHTL